LYASLELSLRRLSSQHRQWVKALAVFRNGFGFYVLSKVLKIETDDAKKLADALVQVGLANYQNYGYYTIDAALSAYLKTQLSHTDYGKWQQSWLPAMCELVDILYDQCFQNIQLALQLTLLEMPNCLSLLTLLPQYCEAEQTATFAGKIEQILQNLHQPQALVLAVKTRQRATASIGIWNRSQFENLRLDIQRLLQQNDLQRAHAQAEALLQLASRAGETAYPDAAFDIAGAYFVLGSALQTLGMSDEALTRLQHSQQRFQALVEAGDQRAVRMIYATLAEQGNCLKDIGKLEAAAEKYQQLIDNAEKLNDKRSVAVGQLQMATVRLLQKDYAFALATYDIGLRLFTQLDELISVAVCWHQTGRVYREMRNFEDAEHCYRQALNLRSQLRDQGGIGLSLNELGNLYADWGRLEEAVVFYRQAADTHKKLGNQRWEGVARTNLAFYLIQLQYHDEARNELQRAIYCKQAIGNSAKPWATWAVLHELEQACHNPSDAHAAKQHAIDSYLAYRRDGGENMSGFNVPQYCQDTFEAIQANNVEQALIKLTALQNVEDLPNNLIPVIPKLIAILQGERSPSLADDPKLFYENAAELLLLLEQLG
jgi:tetratricopeptide (TPR) repeat protein